MNKRRMLNDRLLITLSVVVSAISVIVLTAIMFFIFKTGYKGLSWEVLSGNYYSENVNAAVADGKAGEFKKPAHLADDAYFSEHFGIALKQTLDKHKSKVMEVVYLDPHSPLKQAKITTAGPLKGTVRAPEHGMIIKKIEYLDKNGEKKQVGPLAGMEAEKSVETLDTEAEAVVGYYGQSKGGGIRGSLVAGGMLILISLVIALPLGIFAAVYLHELAPKNAATRILRSGVDMLSGVPSIIFGLMGMTMLYPITRLMGIDGQSIVLGALTMAVILLPLIIRQTEEALKTVPTSMRMGSLSLGANQTQTILKVVLPQAMPGVITACLLSISRIIGESAALIYTMGTAISDYPVPGRGATSPALHIWKIMSGEQPDFELASAISIVILVLVLILNLSTRLLLHYFNNKRLNGSGFNKKKKAYT